MKSLVNSLLTIALGLCKDVQVAYPCYRGLLLDCERLSLTSQTRGLGFFTLDLPHLDSLLIKGLESGRLSLDGPLTHAVSKRIQVPRLFSGLWLRVFDKDGSLKQDADVNAISFLRQLCCLGKKVQSECSPARLQEAVKEYHDIERKLQPPTLNWSADAFDPRKKLKTVHLRDGLVHLGPLFDQGRSRKEGDSVLRGLLSRCQQVADIVTAELGFFEPIRYSSERALGNLPTGFRHGPGAVSDRTGDVNKYDMPRWSAKLEEWFPYRECGTIASDLESQPINHEKPSRLIAVPKTAKSPRLIASEPTEHQWCQQVIRCWMVERLKAVFGREFVCFEDQGLSGQMALQASSDRKLATIDLSSASDRLSCWTVERVLRGNPSLLHALHATRTRYLKENLSGSVEFIKLNKIASQGTATTFPVQTLVFLLIALGCNVKGKVSWQSIRRLRGKVRVFGDDIIIPTTGYAATIEVLTYLGLKVNVEKSFAFGHFREACGVDAYKGYDVTPVRPQSVVADSPTTRRAVLDTSNNLFLKGYWHAASAAESTIDRRVLSRLPIIRRDSGLTGRVSFCGEDFRHLPRRWNDHLHRYEWRTWHIRSRACLVHTGERFAMLQYFTEAPSAQLDWASGYARRRPSTRDGVRWDPLYG